MSEHRGPLVPHSERRNVWVRETHGDSTTRYFGDGYKAEYVPIERSGDFGVRLVDSPSPQPSFWELVLTWTGIFLSGWLSFLVAHAAMEVTLRTVGLQRSAVIAASLGAIVGAVAWLAGRRRP